MMRTVSRNCAASLGAAPVSGRNASSSAGSTGMIRMPASVNTENTISIMDIAAETRRR